MAKIDIRAANREQGVNCEYEGNPGRALLLTPALLAQYPAQEGQNVRAGQIVVTYKDDDNVVRGKVLLPQVNNDLTVVIGRGENARHLTLNSAKDLLNVVRSFDGEDQDANLRGVTAIKDYADYLFTDGLTALGVEIPEIKTAAYSYLENRSRRQERAALTDEQLDLINEVRSIREAIGRIDPDHADALVRNRNNFNGTKARDVMDGAVELHGRDFDPMQRRALKANEALTREVFSKLTVTDPLSIYAKNIDANDYNTLLQEMEPGVVDGGFMNDIRDRLTALFAQRMPGYQPRMQLYTGGGADFLLVADHGGHYVYGWDTDSRVVAAPEDRFAVLGAGDVPEQEEIERLREVLAEIRYDANDADILFGEFGAQMAADAAAGNHDFDLDDDDFNDFDDNYDDYDDEENDRNNDYVY